MRANPWPNNPWPKVTIENVPGKWLVADWLAFDQPGGMCIVRRYGRKRRDVVLTKEALISLMVELKSVTVTVGASNFEAFITTVMMLSSSDYVDVKLTQAAWSQCSCDYCARLSATPNRRFCQRCGARLARRKTL